jgi:hypothetical protein
MKSLDVVYHGLKLDGPSRGEVFLNDAACVLYRLPTRHTWFATDPSESIRTLPWQSAAFELQRIAQAPVSETALTAMAILLDFFETEAVTVEDVRMVERYIRDAHCLTYMKFEGKDIFGALRPAMKPDPQS